MMPLIIAVTKINNELPFCRSTTGKTAELVCFENHCQDVATLVVSDTVLQYGILPGGRFYCVLCGEEFVIAFKSVFCDEREIRINNGKYQYVFNKEGERTGFSEHLLIYEGPLTLYQDGSISVCDYQWPVSPYGNPIVYARNAAAIDSKGNLIIQKKYQYPEMKRYQYIMAGPKGRRCITSDRKIIHQTGVSAPRNKRIIDMDGNTYCDMVLTQHGDVYYCERKNEWHWLATNAIAIAAGMQSDVAIAEKTGVVRIFQFDASGKLRQEKELCFGGKRIVDLDINNHTLAVGFLDGRYEMVKK